MRELISTVPVGSGELPGGLMDPLSVNGEVNLEKEQLITNNADRL